MITELTPEQWKVIEEEKFKWFNHGVSCEPADFETAEQAITQMYKMLGEKKPKHFIRMPSPAACLVAVANAKKGDFDLNIEDTDRALNNLNDKDKEYIRQQVQSCFWGQHESYWVGFYMALQKIGVTYNEESTRLLNLWADISRSINWWWAYENVCFISDRPEVCCLEYESTIGLHCEDGPAVRFRDGYELYSLNGVIVTKEIVMTPAEELDPQLVVTTRNAETRREIVRKIGTERLFQSLKSEVIDRRDDIVGGPYELVVLDIGDGLDKRPFLKMLNPSVDAVHIEGVPPGCATVEDALTSRKPPEMQQIPVAEDGEDWVQHGDVVIWPEEAKSLKPYPAIIT